jgi:hypothetical protein
MMRGVATIAAVFLGVTVVALGAAACGGESAPVSSASPTPSPSHSGATVYADAPVPAKPAKAALNSYAYSALAAPLWDFGLDLLTRQAAKTGGNVVVSPVSLAPSSQ